MERRVELTDPTPELLKDELFRTCGGPCMDWPKVLRIIDLSGKEYRRVAIWKEDGCVVIRISEE